MPNNPVVSRAGDASADRVPVEGTMSRVSDTLVGRPGNADPVHHPEAAAGADADTEAGADQDLGGRTEPLNPLPR